MIRYVLLICKLSAPITPANAWGFVILERERKNTRRKLSKSKNFLKTYAFQRNYVIFSGGFLLTHNMDNNNKKRGNSYASKKKQNLINDEPEGSTRTLKTPARFCRPRSRASKQRKTSRPGTAKKQISSPASAIRTSYNKSQLMNPN